MRLTNSLRRADKTLLHLLATARESGYFGVQYDREHRELLLDDEHLPLGTMLVENVRKKWHTSSHSSVGSIVDLNALGLSVRRQSILDMPRPKLIEKFDKIEKSTAACKVLPFTLREEFVKKSSAASPRDTNDTKDNDRLWVHGKVSTNLSEMLFTSASQSECFMTVQRHRKIWWMKISSNPGRIFATDVKINDNNIHYTSLCSRFRFGDVEMERIECISGDSVLSKKYSTIIRSIVSLESASLGLVLDGLDAAVEDELCLDRTIAPFQCGVICLHSDQDIAGQNTDLLDLTKYVQMLIERSGISTYNNRDANCTDEATQMQRIQHFDTIGIPYVLLISAESLKQGFLKLRNRDTTLCETIHLSDVPDYLLDIFSSH